MTKSYLVTENCMGDQILNNNEQSEQARNSHNAERLVPSPEVMMPTK